jgi:hypothetical protein
MNKYQRWHDAIIVRARGRELDAYKERHHVVPRCLDGSDHPSNLVDLTYREHFLVHWLLTKLHCGRDKVRMVFAVHAMTLGLGPRNVGSWRIDLAKRLLKEQVLKRLAARQKIAQQEIERRNALAREVETGVFLMRQDKEKIVQAAKDWLAVNYTEPPIILQQQRLPKGPKKKRFGKRDRNQFRKLKRALRKATVAENHAVASEIEAKLTELRKPFKKAA